MSRAEFNRAMEWWLKQGDNSKFEVVKTARTEFGNGGFAEIFWEYKGLSGRDRIYKRGSRYELMEVA